MDKKIPVYILAAVVSIVAVYFSLVFLYDQDKPTRDLNDIGINWEKIRAAKDFHDIFQPVEEIALTGNMLGAIRQLIVLHNENIIIRESKNVKLFAADGRFIREIGRIGQGPGEYFRPNKVVADDSLNIYILDGKLRRVIVFDSLGQLKRHLALENFVDEMAISGHRLYFYSSMNYYRDNMACCYDNLNGNKLFDFAVPTGYLLTFKSNMVPSLLGFGEYLRAYGEKIYIAHPYEYAIREFSLDGKELRQIKGKLRFFSPTDSAKKFDININIPPSEFLGSLIKTFLIWDDLLFVFFGRLNSQEMYMDIFRLDGKQINESSIAFKGSRAALPVFYLAIAPNGYFYSHYQPEPKSPLEVPNPIMIKYKFLPFDGNAKPSKDRGGDL